MKVQIKTGDRDFSLSLPTKMIFSKFVLRMVFKSARLGEKAVKLSPDGAEVLIAELQRIKKRHGTWELVEVQSADGEIVKVTL